MDWTQVLTIVGANVALMIGMFSTYLSLYLHSDKKLEDFRKETTDLMKAIQEEMKDFHGRLCAIEERNRK
jgi:hypothetical protein